MESLREQISNKPQLLDREDVRPRLCEDTLRALREARASVMQGRVFADDAAESIRADRQERGER